MLYLHRYLLFRIFILIFKICKYILVKIDDKLFYMLTDRHRMVLRNILIVFCLLLLADLRGD